MDPDFIPYLAGLSLAVAAVAACLWERARARALRAEALALGLIPSEDDLEALPLDLRSMSLFGVGRGREASNVLWGERRDFLIFDYRYSTGSGKNSTTYRQTVGAFHIPGRNLPAFTAAPEGLGDWIAEWFGGQDIDIPGDPRFSEEYRLKGSDEGAIRDFFSVGGTQYLAARPGWTVHARGDWLLAYRARKRIQPKRLKDFLWDLQGLYGALLGV